MRNLVLSLLGVALVVAGGLVYLRTHADRMAADGRTAYENRDWPRAAALLGAAVAIKGSDAKLRTDLGWALLMQFQCYPAQDQFRRAVAIEPGLAEANRGLEISSRCASVIVHY